MKYKKVAIVIHPLSTWGGAEYNLDVLAGIFNNPTIYTAWSDKHFIDEHLSHLKIRNSFLNILPFKRSIYKLMIPLHPFAYLSFDLSKYDLVIVISDGFEKLIRKPKGTDLVHYVLTPARFLWMGQGSIRDGGVFYLVYKRFLANRLRDLWKKFDRKFAGQADLTLSISQVVQKRVARYYGVDSKVIYPPVEVDTMKFNRSVEKREDWFLYMGRVESYKGVEHAIKACAETGSKLKIAGIGSELERMKDLVAELKVKHLVGFLDFVSEKMKRELLFKCKALIYPVMAEDFGIVPVEANASGCPVIAYNSGGVKETIKDGRTGILYDKRTEGDLADAILSFDRMSFSADECRKQAMSFSRESFENKIRNELNGLIKR